MLTKAEITQIFARVPELISVHEKICDDLQRYIRNWEYDRPIGKVQIEWSLNFEKCFVV